MAVCLRCAQLQHTVKHQGSQQDTNNLKDCLKVLNECGENIPICVTLLGRNCSSCSPPGFGNMDASDLLSSMKWWLRLEASSMREALEAQGSISEDLEPAVVAMDRRIMAVKELHTVPGKIQRAEGVSGHEEEDVQDPIAPPPQPEQQGWHAQPLFPVRSLVVRKGKSKPRNH